MSCEQHPRVEVTQSSSKRKKVDDRVQVFVRLRPSSRFTHESIEIIRGEPLNSIQIHGTTDACQWTDNRYPGVPQSANHLQKSWRFDVDDVLYNADQSEVYSTVTEKLVSRALDGFSGTLIAYGESGSGKTFTLSGARDNSDFGQRGLSPRAIGHIFQHLNSEQCKTDEFRISISYLEVDGNKLTDLLVDQQPKKKLEIFEDEENPGATKVDGLSKNPVHDEIQAFGLFLKGDSRRSRKAHAIFTIHIHSKSHTISGGKRKSAELKFVDLTSWGRTELETSKISAASAPSLTFLEQVVISLQTKCKNCIPWRSCPLTHVLKGSFKRGNAILLCTIFGDKKHLHGSLTTLRFASRLNNIDVEAARIEVSDAETRVTYLEGELQKLKDELKMRYILSRVDDKAPACANYEPLTIHDIESARQNVRDYLLFKTHNLDVLSLRHVNKLFELMRDEYVMREKGLVAELKREYVFLEKDAEVLTTGGKSSAAIPSNAKSSKESANSHKDDKKSSKEKKSDKKGKRNLHAEASRTSVQAADSSKQISQTDSQLNVDTELSDKKSSMETGTVSEVEMFNIGEAFEDFKKNGGRNSYMNILSCKKSLLKNKQSLGSFALKINSLVDEIQLSEIAVDSFSVQHPETEVITEEECLARQQLAAKKNDYIKLKEEFNKLQIEEIEIQKELELQRKNLMLEFSEEYPNNDIFSMTNLECMNKKVYDQTQPPFTISQQKEQDHPSFGAWQGARMELARCQQTATVQKTVIAFK